MTLQDALQRASKMLSSAGVKGGARDARVLLEALENYREIFLSGQLDEADGALYFSWIQRRMKFEPVSHILGMRLFWKDAFVVNEHVLDPRPESEIFIETVCEHFAPTSSLQCLDLGAGSGCLGLSILHEFPQATCCFVDISKPALEVAKTNARRLKRETRSCFLESDWLSAVNEQFDLVVCNPPYISFSDYQGLAPDVFFEPDIALTDFDDGLSVYRMLARQIVDVLKPGGIALFEFGIGQHDTLKGIFAEVMGSNFRFINDISGRPRLIEVTNS